MSSSSPEDGNCVVAVKFLGSQLSFFRIGQRNYEWINIRIANPCFFSSPVMFSKKDYMFHIPGSGGHRIGSWDDKQTPKIQRLQFQNLPKLTMTKRELLDSCCTTELLLDSRSTNEIFLVKWYKKTTGKIIKGLEKKKTKAVMVFRLDEKGNAVYTQDIGDLCISLSESEPSCDPASSCAGLWPNHVVICDDHEFEVVNLACSPFVNKISLLRALQNID